MTRARDSYLSMTRQLFIKNLTNLDFAWLDPVQGILGESLHVSAYLEGELDERGFIMDFGPCKKWLRELIDEHLDHRCAIPVKAQQFKLLEETNLKTHFKFDWSHGHLEYLCPNQALSKIDCAQINLPILESYLENIAEKNLPPRVANVQIVLEEESRFKDEPSYRYTHGLKLHGGNCQRLFHGHRNPVEVTLNDERNSEMEQFISRYYHQVHFVPVNSLEDHQPLWPIGFRQFKSEEILKISYQSPQGTFKSSLPLKDCIILEQEPSIENIAHLTWNIVKDKFDLRENDTLVVHCYEGINKGCSFGN